MAVGGQKVSSKHTCSLVFPTKKINSALFAADHGYYALSDDDDVSSTHSGNYSARHYVSGHYEEEDDAQQVPEEGKLRRPTSSSSKTTRFGSEGNSRSPRRAELQSNARASPLVAHQQLQRQGSTSPPDAGRRNDEDDRRGRMSRNRSMVDMRSQLLHRTLVEELNRRMFFNTVAAVENIGFRMPPGYGSSASSSRRRQPWQEKQRR
jgi:WNK lysine deficient protein kinase